MGRPKLNDTEKKERRLTVRFRPDEMTWLAGQAETCGLSLSELLHRRALQRKVIPVTDLKTISELRRVGGLIKHLFNETGGLYRRQTSLLLDELHAAIIRVGRREEAE